MSTIQSTLKSVLPAAALSALLGLTLNPLDALAQTSAEVQVLQEVRTEYGSERIVLSRVELAEITREDFGAGVGFSAPPLAPHETTWLTELESAGLIQGYCEPEGSDNCVAPGTLSLRMSRLRVEGPEGTIYVVINGETAGDSWHRLTSFKFEQVDGHWKLTGEVGFVFIT